MFFELLIDRVSLLHMQEEEGFLKENTLILKFSVRAPTYYHKCRDLTE